MDYSKDYYSILGVKNDASAEDISSAYKKLMKKWHPDLFASKSKDEQDEATRHSSEINEAYDILSDRKKREEYDMVRSGRGGFRPSSPFGDMGGMAEEMYRHMHGGQGFWDLDESMFKRPRPERVAIKGTLITKTVELPFEDFFFGCSKTCTMKVLKCCEHCNGGVIGDEEEWTTCDVCNGKGIEVFMYGMGNYVRQTCRRCGGCGSMLKNKCTYCGGSGISQNETRTQTMEFTIPRGTYGMWWKQTYYNIGNAGVYGGQNGDVVITATVSKNGLFFPSGAPERLCTIHYVNFFKAMAGGAETIMTPYGTKTIMLPSELKDGQTIKYGGAGLKGIKRQDGSSCDGDLYVTFKYELPTNLDEKDMERFNELAKIYDGEPSKFTNIATQMNRSAEYLKRCTG